jgi:hypothetical protein
MYQVIVRAQMCGDNVFLKIAALESGRDLCINRDD